MSQKKGESFQRLYAGLTVTSHKKTFPHRENKGFLAVVETGGTKYLAWGSTRTAAANKAVAFAIRELEIVLGGGELRVTIGGFKRRMSVREAELRIKYLERLKSKADNGTIWLMHEDELKVLKAALAANDEAIEARRKAHADRAGRQYTPKGEG